MMHRTIRYGLLASAVAMVGGAPPLLDVKEFLASKSHYVGKPVIVRGSASCTDGKTCFLYAEKSSTVQSVVFDAAKLPQKDLRRLHECYPYVQECRVGVVGVARSGSFPGLTARSINWSGG
jgi:hypothetical protein